MWDQCQCKIIAADNTKPQTVLDGRSTENYDLGLIGKVNECSLNIFGVLDLTSPPN